MGVHDVRLKNCTVLVEMVGVVLEWVREGVKGREFDFTQGDLSVEIMV